MELRGYVDALRLRWLLVAGTAVLGLVVGLVAYLVTPPVWTSAVTFYVSVPPAVAGGPATAAQYAQAKVSSYVTLVQSEEVARRVIADQRLDASPAAVAATVTASAQLNTTVLTATVATGSKDRSVAVARGLADTFGPLVDELDNAGRPAEVVAVDVVSGPTVPTAPAGPDLKRFLALGLLAGLVLGALLAVLRDLLDLTVRSAAVAAAAVGAPTLGVVDEDREDRGRAESVRQLRTNLGSLRVGQGPPSRAVVVLVTSALRGEGKTTTALDLARSFARAGERVLLVEADLRRPVLAKALRVEPVPGLSEVLTGRVELATALRHGADGVDLLPAGSVPPDPAELLGSDRMATLVATLRSGYDRVLVDSPPVLPVTDAVVCSAFADGVLLVVRWGRTRRAEVSEASRLLGRGRATLLGCVLDGRRLTRAERRRYASEPPELPESPTSAVAPPAHERAHR